MGASFAVSHAFRIVEGGVGISYDDDPVRRVEAIEQALKADPGVTDAPASVVGIERFNDSSVDIAYRYWVPSDAFFVTQYRVNLAVLEAPGRAGVTIPFPQRDVRLSQTAAA